ncbi:cysteine hydrolase family protein [Marinomonas pollencensis]|uniref:Nicotinamidase-related amidase n=1 Tax=Marinomonas pollencensis TaxID=491954 RepID=A0A3E0DSJ7_9GAMM|nr:cysteine hydrolase family protein [Marinomonas pollencensis]REG84378.1 nicotinamidase-related amidase [Marinomonas pollencensis]
MKQTALLVIDVQNDYFDEGLFPLWNTQSVLNNILDTMKHALANNTPIIFIQHVADPAEGDAPFFNPATHGVELHPQITALAPNAPLVIKHFADSFEQTNLEEVLSSLNVETLLLCGMMTQHCITHTALSASAEKYQVEVIGKACTTREALLHHIALAGLSRRVNCVSIEKAASSLAG